MNDDEPRAASPGVASQQQPTEQADRAAQPVDAEQPPRLPFPVVGIGGSAGGLEAFRGFFKGMPPDSGMAFVLILHLPPDRESMLAEILARYTEMPVRQVEDGTAVQPNHVYVIRPGHAVMIEHGVLKLGKRLEKPANDRPVDDFFKSLAREQRERAICIVMSGMGSNGTLGAQAVKAVGGICIAQDPQTAQAASMPRHVIDAGYADYILTLAEMPEVLLSYVRHPYVRDPHDADTILRREQQYLHELLAILRTRTRQDFSGYRKSTVLRRVQRRMGLSQVERIADYTKILRQSPSEVTALGDDLLIHVTGFFRDNDAWESLRQRVIAPMVEQREPGGSVRCWVTACSSGEEAYTLAMLLVEEAEKIAKPLNITVFATDMAERSLKNARLGIYPGGIETEIAPQRLERFFQREDAVYRVRQDLRERVVFAWQNVLQDPPFSRLDIITCRNMLIYLEPELQRRVLQLFHFGLREGGAMFLGNSETVAGAEQLFETVDKQARIFRRIGPARHAELQFPLPRGANPADLLTPPKERIAPAPIGQLTVRAILKHHAPAAVTINREQQIVYFHGDTNPYLEQPRGDASRDLLAMARESLRGAIRQALTRARSEGAPATAMDGWIELAPGKRVRVEVTASPLDAPGARDHFVISFNRREDQPLEPPDAGGNGNAVQQGQELGRVRQELQNTVEELQTSNEELKASHLEVTSVNEELQSTNEELETSKEEMQSLNEELITLNAQLQAKIEEHQAMTNDLASLLTSTDIAVLFLDTRFRIRRFTPPLGDLLELIAADVGRPLNDLARKFDDPALLSDAQTVLDRLVPVEAEISAHSGRAYLRRITPYRTTENRIDGVVITFVDITERKAAIEALRESEERFRLLVEGARDFAMMMMDSAGRIIAWNAGAERLLGYSEAAVLGKSGAIIFTAEDRAAGADELEISQATATGRVSDERWHVREDGTRFWGSGVMTVLRQPDGSLRGFVKVMRDETIRKEAEGALQKAKDTAELANRIKDEFLATLSHELRTPLSSILLWSKMIRAKPEGAAEHAEAIDAIVRSAEAQKQLIDDLLDTSRITSGKLRLDMRHIELAPLVRRCVDGVLPTADLKQVKVNSDAIADVGIVLVDPDRMQQVLWNLLSNAVKFTPAGGRVDVALSRNARTVQIRVSDTGKGIDAGFLPLVFEPFRQAESSTTRAYGGLGLGLAICKQLVEQHGGTITAASEGPGRGATFTVRLPLPESHPGAAFKTAPAVDTPAPPGGKSLAGIRVLLVEDEPDTRKALVTLLRTAGAQVTDVDSAAAAMDALDRSWPDLLISDIGMPDEDGYGLIRRVRTLESTWGKQRLPAVALTAFAHDLDRDQAVAAGFDRHVGKPIEAERLMSILAVLAARH